MISFFSFYYVTVYHAAFWINMSFNPQDYPVCRGVQLASFALLDGIKERVVEENI